MGDGGVREHAVAEVGDETGLVLHRCEQRAGGALDEGARSGE